MRQRRFRYGPTLCLACLVTGVSACGGGGAVGSDGGLPEVPDATTTKALAPCAGPVECYPSYQASMCPGVVLKKLTISFDPKDSRWATNYQTCIESSGGFIRPTECDWFCDDLVGTNATLQASTGFGSAAIDCTRPDHPTITVEYSTIHCDPGT